MRICVVGVGSIGGVLASGLAQVDEVDASVLARGATLSALASGGLRVTGAAGTVTTKASVVTGGPGWTSWQGSLEPWRLAASDDAASLGVQDVVIVSVKAQSM